MSQIPYILAAINEPPSSGIELTIMAYLHHYMAFAYYLVVENRVIIFMLLAVDNISRALLPWYVPRSGKKIYLSAGFLLFDGETTGPGAGRLKNRSIINTQ